MESEKKISPLIKASLVYVIATAIGQGMHFVEIVVFTRLMDQSDYGEYSTYYAYVSILTVLIGANLYYALNNAYIEKRNEIKEFRKSTLILSVIIMVLVALLLFIGNSLVSRQFPNMIVIMAILHSYGFFVISYRVYSANMENDVRKKQWLLILPNMFQLLLAFVLVSAFPYMTCEARIVGSTIGVDIVAAIAFFEMMRGNGKCVDCRYWKYALSIALPTIIMSLSYMLMQQCDKVMICTLCGSEDAAIYSVIYYIGYIIVAVDQAVAPVRQAWIFQKIDAGDVSKARQLQKWYLFIMGIFICVTILSGPEFVKILAPQNYWKFEYVVPFILNACMMLLYRFYVEVILFYKSNIALSLCVLFCALVNIALNMVLIPYVGAIAACYTTVVSYGILFILTKVLANRHIRGLYNMRYFGIFMGWVAAVACLSFFIYERIVIRYTILGVIILVMLMYGCRTRMEWKMILEEDSK